MEKINVENIEKELKQVKSGERVKCIYCGEDIHISKFAGVSKKGLFCNSFFCLLELIKENEQEKGGKKK
ncbi:hypothetical protein LCGC14_0556470 [marine sediment metagenome]|uniref:Uncharacterized protein n=1 Tax=marine sediment metagenome TaxID=412755 RepID=A0A0F9RTD4_9ZZZZ